jgi:mRNA interferase MazF
MEKDFDRWNEIKKNIDHESKNKKVETGSFHWCSLGLNVGTEINGKDLFFRRPVFVLKRISYSKCLVVPLTTSGREYKHKERLGFIKGRKNYLLLDQIKIIDTKRILNQIYISNEDISQKATKIVLDYLDDLRKSLLI